MHHIRIIHNKIERACSNIIDSRIQMHTCESLGFYILTHGWASFSHEGPDLEKLLKPRAAL